MMPNQPCNQFQRSSSCPPGRTVPPRMQGQQRSTAPCMQPQQRTAPSCPREQMSREQLLHLITLTKFAMVDATLYLDTHPDDEEAIRYFQVNSRLYQEALADYSKAYGPLTLSHAHHNDTYWDWVNQPWPWQ